MRENLVSFPAPPRVAPDISHACGVFLERWDGADIEGGARLLSDLLPEHVPGPLKLVILRALRQLDVPPFPSSESFRAAVERFATGAPELRTLVDVRRARRDTRVTLDAIARQASLPVYILRQLEWGDFRQWHNAEWSARVARAYARAARLDPDRVGAIIEEERASQLNEAARPVPASLELSDDIPRRPAGFLTPPTATDGTRRSRSRVQSLGLAAAAVGMFAAGLAVGGTIVERRSTPDGLSTVPQAVARPAAEAGAKSPSTMPAKQEAAKVTPSSSPPIEPQSRAASQEQEPTVEVVPRAADGELAPRVEPSLTSASGAGGPAFSPSFSNVGSAVFYHRDEGVGTALVKADRDAATGDLHVINIVEDNARNYHVRPSPDGSRIAFDSDREGERGVYIANADGTDVRRVSGPGFAAVPSWSPDGSLLAFVRAERDLRTWNLWLLNLQTNEMRRVTDYRYGQPWGASWFPDGRRVAYSHEDRLTVLDLPTGTKRLFTSPRADRLIRTPAVSPDGRHIVFQVYRDGAWMLDLRDGSMQRILTDPTAEEFAWDSTGHRLAFHSRRSGTWSVWIMAGPSS